MRIAIIGGTGVYDPRILSDIREERVATPYGEVSCKIGRYKGEEVLFLARHGEKHSVPPHLVNYQANIWALKKVGITRIIATAAVGSLNPDLRPGDFVFTDQFIDFTHARPFTFFEGGERGVVHTDFTEPYCPEIRGAMEQRASTLGIRYHNRGTYLCTEGPRYETPAEIKAFARLGADLVGMTNVPEVVLAHEAGICYGLVAMVTNFASGISPTPLTHEEVLEVMAENGEKLKALAMGIIESLPVTRTCHCGDPWEHLLV
ncbi:MAG: S-methyl-5'-thioadenosine phosphorylase [Firmicutes bacterium]|nr:S-methyl-5'-thioadenosine phosphorylase [Bacillota bacterium]MCL5038921.1 S-methyl-5'-thioadenosine phosphorylase [Bacillota bacterium]